MELIGAPRSNFVHMARAEESMQYTLIEAWPKTPETNAIHPFSKGQAGEPRQNDAG
jgi:hypothetical protein